MSPDIKMQQQLRPQKPEAIMGEERLREPANSGSKMSQCKAVPVRLLKMIAIFLTVCIASTFIGVYLIKYFGLSSVIGASASPSGFVVQQPCVMESNSLRRWIRPTSNLLHSMSDEELFWRASFVPRIEEYPFNRVPKVAFLFLTKGPLPLAPLWERFLNGYERFYSVYVHSLPSFQAKFKPSSVFYGRHIPCQVTEWGKMSMIDAEKRLLANALLDISNERFVLLSESCIPLYNFTFTYNYLMNSQESFVGVFDDPGRFGRGRYNLNMAPEVSIRQWRKGSQWFEVNRRVAASIMGDTKYYSKFEQFCRGACYVDEHYFPTMLSIQVPSLLANRSITLVDWSRGGPHPATFGRADIKEERIKRLLEGHKCNYNHQPSSICFLFARKFAPSSLEPLLRLGFQLFGY